MVNVLELKADNINFTRRRNSYFYQLIEEDNKGFLMLRLLCGKSGLIFVFV